MTARLSLDGRSLNLDDLALVAAGPVQVDVAPSAVAAVRDSWSFVSDLVTRRSVYGRTTGVGANRDTAVELGLDNDLRLLRSHASGSGPVLPAAVTRTAMVVRLNQILRGGSGMHAAIVDALRAALASDDVPRVRTWGGIGTGDLSALGEMALGLMGEATLTNGEQRVFWEPSPGDALPLLSSNAFTVAQAALAAHRLRAWLRHHELTAALSLVAVNGSAEPLQRRVQEANPHRGQAGVAAMQRHLIEPVYAVPARLQDSFGFRTMPQVTGALVAAVERLEEVLAIEMNSSPENPLIDVETQDVFHNGNFHAMPLALALDDVKLALAAVTQLSMARVADLVNPSMTGLARFLASGPEGSNGAMLMEYNQAAAQTRLRLAAMPATLGSVVISRGVENHSSFAAQAAEQLGQCIDAALDVLACELLGASRSFVVRAQLLPEESELGAYLAGACAVTSPEVDDRALGDDLAAVRAFVAQPAATTRR